MMGGISSATTAGNSSLTVRSVTADAETNPLGVEAAAPRLAWKLASVEKNSLQSGYQVLVASSEEQLDGGFGDIWDSSQVASSTSIGIVYAGKALAAGTRYFWKVRVWDAVGTASAWSEVAHWEMGLLRDCDWSGAKWIGAHAPSEWPEGTVAEASSFHAPVDDRSYEPQNAIDDNPTTFWNDDTAGAFPDWITITSPISLELNAITIVSQGDGVIVDYTVDTWDGSVWVQQGCVTGNSDIARVVTFAAPVTTKGLQITVTSSQMQNGNFTRITAIEPGIYRGTTTPAVASAPILRKDFSVQKHVTKARAYVSGLGIYVLSIDGTRVGDSVMDPGFTNYDKSALYASYDVTDAVAKKGAHALGVTLGRGFYDLDASQAPYWGSAPWLRRAPVLRLKLQLDYSDGSSDTVVTDASWTWSDGPTTTDSVYMGESYDARLEQPGWDKTGFDESNWNIAAVQKSPTKNLHSQRMEPIRVTGSMRAVDITNPKQGTYVLKFGEVTAGWVKLSIVAAAGTAITLRYGETLRTDGTVDNDGDPGLTIGPVQTDSYTTRGAGAELWQPRFSYKGFQYVQVDGYPRAVTSDDVIAQVVHSDVLTTGVFASSNALLNTIHDMTQRTILNNMHSIMTDTPLFEKRGWLGDANVLIQTATDNFGMHRFYRNWLTSITDNQGADGSVVELSPNPSSAPGYTEPIWAGAIIDMPWQLYQEYGDRDTLASNFDAMVKYLDFLIAHSTGLIQDGFYGDWVSPAISGTFPYAPEGAKLTATAYFYKYAQEMSQAAAVLGKPDDRSRFATLARQIKDVFNAKFLDSVNGRYHTDSAVGYRQTSNAIPLSFGLVPSQFVSAITKNLVADVQAKGNHLNTGLAGTKELLPALTEQGNVDTAFAIATQDTYPSWGFWIANGATALWEAWEANTRSRNHAFLGTVDDWFYRYLAGIRLAAVGFSEISIHPYVPTQLAEASASMVTVSGTVSSAWTKSATGSIKLDITVPANAKATVDVPILGDHANGALPSHDADAIFTGLTADGEYASFEVGSGDWTFGPGFVIDGVVTASLDPNGHNGHNG
jgi:alpha-L-rhamnosidase